MSTAPVRRGAVAVIRRQSRLLVIRRSLHVAAPGALCFPGGGLEQDETEAEALIRELREELGVAVEPLARVWRSATTWGVELAWWQARLPADAVLAPSAAEVAEAFWIAPDELAERCDLLESNREFLAKLAGGAIRLSP